MLQPPKKIGRRRPAGDAKGVGQAAGALKNREREVRNRIIDALEMRQIPPTQWPAIVQRPSGPELHQTHLPNAFQPPPFERLHESISAWKDRAQAAFAQYLGREIKQIEAGLAAGVDEPIPASRSKRGPGRSGRNAAKDVRYEWTARRLRGELWKQIAPIGVSADAVRKAFTETLRGAVGRYGGPVKLTAIGNKHSALFSISFY